MSDILEYVCLGYLEGNLREHDLADCFYLQYILGD